MYEGSCQEGSRRFIRYVILAAPLRQSFEAGVHNKWCWRYGNSTIDGGLCVVDSHSLSRQYGDSVLAVGRSGEYQRNEQRSRHTMVMIGTARTIWGPPRVADWLATGHAARSSAACHRHRPGCIIASQPLHILNSMSPPSSYRFLKVVPPTWPGCRVEYVKRLRTMLDYIATVTSCHISARCLTIAEPWVMTSPRDPRSSSVGYGVSLKLRTHCLEYFYLALCRFDGLCTLRSSSKSNI